MYSVFYYFLVPTGDEIISKFLYDGCGLLWLNGVLIDGNNHGCNQKSTSVVIQKLVIHFVVFLKM